MGKVRLEIELDEELYELLFKAAEKAGTSLSSFLESLLRNEILGEGADEDDEVEYEPWLGELLEISDLGGEVECLRRSTDESLRTCLERLEAKSEACRRLAHEWPYAEEVRGIGRAIEDMLAALEAHLEEKIDLGECIRKWIEALGYIRESLPESAYSEPYLNHLLSLERVLQGMLAGGRVGVAGGGIVIKGRLFEYEILENGRYKAYGVPLELVEDLELSEIPEGVVLEIDEDGIEVSRDGVSAELVYRLKYWEEPIPLRDYMNALACLLGDGDLEVEKTGGWGGEDDYFALYVSRKARPGESVGEAVAALSRVMREAEELLDSACAEVDEAITEALLHLGIERSWARSKYEIGEEGI